jgi:predicted ATP-dependent endonuclease of OLD family
LFEYLIEGESIKLIKDANAIKENITKTNAESFLKENQKLLDKEKLEEIIADKLAPSFDASFPKVQIWKPEKEYLINSVIDLNTFKENPDTSLPLKYIFHLIGKDTTEKIKIAVERALNSQEKSDELKDNLSDAVTKALNKKWKEHKVKILISINGTSCQVHVQDIDTKNKYYRMNQRSDGFKQFVSLILSLSLLNDSKKLENNIILIDEPEIHLHPSGVQEMRHEILKIGQKNQVFISTHSHYMVDTSCPERHWIVKKEKSQTSITPIDENTPIEDDTVISAAFGLNLFKELLPKNIIVVEGGDDKCIIHHCLKKLSNRFFYSIKSAGGASKMPSVASLLTNENVRAFFLFDDDNEGTSNKKKITDNYKDCFNKDNVFTIRDLDNSIPQKSTLEDLIPLSLVKDFFEKELSQTFTLDESSPFLFQLKNQNSSLKANKDKLDSLKLKLSEKFVEEFDTKEKIENEAPKMASLVNNLIQKINNHEL